MKYRMNIQALALSLISGTLAAGVICLWIGCPQPVYAVPVHPSVPAFPDETKRSPAPMPLPDSATAAGLQLLTYEQAVEEGMRLNLDLLAAKYNIPLAEADELTAGLINNPSLLLDTIAEPFGKNWDQTNAGGPRQFDIIFSYPLDLSGKIGAGRKSAHEAANVAKAVFQDVMRQKLRDIRLAYIDVMTFLHQLELAKEKENNLHQLVDIIENRIGGAGKMPLLRLRAQLARNQAALDRRQKEITLRAAQTALAVLLGRSREAGLLPSTPFREFKMPEPAPLDSLIALALKNRPDIQALRLSLEKAELDRKLAVAQKWDNFVVTAGRSTQGPTSANPYDPASSPLPRANSWNMGVTIPLPFFNRNQGNIHKAVLAGEQLRKQADALELSTRQEIAGIYDRLILNRRLIIDYETWQLASARKVRDEQQKLVGMGSTALLDYFDAVGAYTAAISAYYDAVGEYRRDVARLNAACAEEMLP